MERILLGYDGNAGADAALEWVADRAWHRDARVEVVIITNPLLQDRPLAEAQLTHAEQRLRSKIPSLPVETARIDGAMPGALTDEANDADLLVIGIDPDRPAREALHGWMSVRISAKSPVPTCIVPAGWSATPGPVTLGVAGDASSASAPAFAAAEAVEGGEILRVVHAWSPPSGGTLQGGPHHEERDRHRELIDGVVTRAHRDHPDLTIDPVLVGDNALAALTAATADSSMIVIGTHGRGVLAGGFYGSVAQGLIGSLRIPVVVVPAPD
jgi:nucleotide-binding universal stress UspA family protein